MSTEKKRTGRRINVIDVIVILLVLALIATAVYRIYTEISKSPSNKQSDYIVTFECDSEYRNMLSYLKNGQAVYLGADGTLLGYLYDVEGDGVGAVYEIVADGEKTQNDPYVKTTLGGYFKLASNAVKAKSGGYYTVDHVNIAVGSKLEVYTTKAVFTVTVKSITTDAQ